MQLLGKPDAKLLQKITADVSKPDTNTHTTYYTHTTHYTHATHYTHNTHTHTHTKYYINRLEDM